MPAIRPVPVQRRHTVLFCEQIQNFSPVFLDTEVDATAIVAARVRAQDAQRRLSVVTIVVISAGKVLNHHPSANTAIDDTDEPNIIEFDTVDAKVTLDKTLDGHRVVLATVIGDVNSLGTDEVQRLIDDAAVADADTDSRFAGIRAMQSLPADHARAAFAEAASDLSRRSAITGTFAVTSLGHSAVDSFYSIGGTTITIGVGRIVDRAVVRDGVVVVAPVIRLTLTFDHRVIDGAEAADILTELKSTLEGIEI